MRLVRYLLNGLTRYMLLVHEWNEDVWEVFMCIRILYLYLFYGLVLNLIRLQLRIISGLRWWNSSALALSGM